MAQGRSRPTEGILGRLREERAYPMGSEEACSQGSLEEAGYRCGRVTGPRREALGPAKMPAARRPCRAVPPGLPGASLPPCLIWPNPCKACSLPPACPTWAPVAQAGRRGVLTGLRDHAVLVSWGALHQRLAVLVATAHVAVQGRGWGGRKHRPLSVWAGEVGREGGRGSLGPAARHRATTQLALSVPRLPPTLPAKVLPVPWDGARDLLVQRRPPRWLGAVPVGVCLLGGGVCGGGL